MKLSKVCVNVKSIALYSVSYKYSVIISLSLSLSFSLPACLHISRLALPPASFDARGLGMRHCTAFCCHEFQPTSPKAPTTTFDVF